MIVLKEIKQKDYLKGTKALRVRHYLGVAFVFMFFLPGIPLYYQYKRDKPAILEAQKKREEAEMEKARKYFELKNMMYESMNKPDPHQRK